MTRTDVTTARVLEAKRILGLTWLRHLPKVTQQRWAGVPQIENGIGNGNEIGRVIIHAEGVCCL